MNGKYFCSISVVIKKPSLTQSGMKSILALAIGLLVSFAAVAQPHKDPTTWSAKVVKQPAQIGDVVTVRIEVTIANGWHMYSNDLDPNIGPVPTTLKFPNSDAFSLVGKATPKGVEEVYEEVWGAKVRQFKNKAVFEQKIKVLKPTGSFSGSAEYQVCSDKDGICLPPTETEFSVDLKVNGIAATAPQSTSTSTVATAPQANSITTKPTSETAVAATTPTTAQTAVESTAEPSVKEALKTPEEILEKTTTPDSPTDTSMMGFIVAAFLSGLLALLTPCVFPIIPMTVSFFTNQQG